MIPWLFKINLIFRLQLNWQPNIRAYRLSKTKLNWQQIKQLTLKKMLKRQRKQENLLKMKLLKKNRKESL